MNVRVLRGKQYFFFFFEGRVIRSRKERGEDIDVLNSDSKEKNGGQSDAPFVFENDGLVEADHFRPELVLLCLRNGIVWACKKPSAPLVEIGEKGNGFRHPYPLKKQA